MIQHDSDGNARCAETNVTRSSTVQQAIYAVILRYWPLQGFSLWPSKVTQDHWTWDTVPSNSRTTIWLV